MLLYAISPSSLHHFLMFIHCIPHVNLLAILTLIFFSLHFRIIICRISPDVSISIQFSSSLRHCGILRTATAHSDILLRLRLAVALLSTIQPFGDTSYDRRVRNCCHEQCGVIMLNACRRCDSCAILCIWKHSRFSILLHNRHRNDNSDDDETVDDRK